MNNEKTMPSAVYVVESQPSAPAGLTSSVVTSSRRPSTRKYAVIGVTSVVIVTLIVIGTLVAVKLITDAHVETWKYQNRFRTGDTEVEESITEEDGKNWIHRYHLTSSDRETWALEDYSQDLEIFKLKQYSGDFACFVIRRSYNTTVSPKDIFSGNNSDIAATANRTEVRFKVSEQPISDSSKLLSPAGQKFCDQLDVYLASPADGTASGEVRRQKRWWYCFTDWMTCTIYTWGSRTYYGCRTVCRFFR